MNVWITEPIAVSALAQLRAQSHLALVDDPALAEIALIRSRTQIDKAFLNQAPRLRAVVTATSGFEHMDWKECQQRGITVAHTPDANAASAAELTWTLILALERQLLLAAKNVRSNNWRTGLVRPHGLAGQTLGIIGLGRIGGRVARMGQLFGMRVVAYDPYVEVERFSASGPIERLGLIELLMSSDYLSLHVPLTCETRHLLNHATLKEMTRHARLINTSRGAVVSENDLITALDEGVIAAAACDVIEREPPPKGHRVLNHPKILLTPHIGAYTESAWERSSLEAAEKVIAFSSGGAHLADTLPLNTPWFDLTEWGREC